MWLFVAEIFCIYALAAILTFKETRTVAFVTSGGSFIFPVIAIYVAVALVTFLAQTSNLTLESAFELGWVATVIRRRVFPLVNGTFVALGRKFVGNVMTVHDSVAFMADI